MTAAHIRLTGWGWRHAGRKSWAVRDVTLAIEPGERVLLLGASGAGKSTLVHALAGVLGENSSGAKKRSTLFARARQQILHVDSRRRNGAVQCEFWENFEG